MVCHLAQLGHGLTTKRSTKVTKKDKQGGDIPQLIAQGPGLKIYAFRLDV
jgi:hypothetical protein